MKCLSTKITSDMVLHVHPHQKFGSSGERKKKERWDYLLIQLSVWTPPIMLRLQKPHRCSQPSKHVSRPLGRLGSALKPVYSVFPGLCVDVLLFYTVCYFKRRCVLSWNMYDKHCSTDLQQIDWFYTSSWQSLRNITQHVSIFHKPFSKENKYPKGTIVKIFTSRTPISFIKC